MMQDVREVPVPASTGNEELQAPNETVLSSVGEGTPEAQAASVEQAEDELHHEVFLGLDSYGWVGIAFAFFVGILIWQKVPQKIADALDSRGRKVRTELDEARALRAEAETILAEQVAKAEQAAKDAEAMMANAKGEADALIADAEASAAAMIARRKESAQQKIAAAERAAEQDLRARVATLATEAARRVIADETGAAERQAMTDKAIRDLGTRLN